MSPEFAIGVPRIFRRRDCAGIGAYIAIGIDIKDIDQTVPDAEIDAGIIAASRHGIGRFACVLHVAKLIRSERRRQHRLNILIVA